MTTRLTRRAAVTGAVAVTLAGCGEPVQFGPQQSATSAAPTGDGSVTVDKEFFARSTRGTAMTMPEGTWGEQRVSTPHMDFTVQAWFVGDRLSRETAAQVDQDTDLRPPAGHDLVAFALKGGFPSYESESGNAADAYLMLGDRPVELPGLFDKFSPEAQAYTREWEFMVAAVPKGAPVQLHVTDEKLTVMVDMRTGVPIDDKDGAWERNTGFRERQRISVDPARGVFHRRLEVTPEGGEKVETTLRIGLQPVPAAGLLPWTPTGGWAEKGKQWLAVPMNPKVDVVGPQMLPMLKIEVPQSFTYIEEQGGRIPATFPTSVTTEAIARGQGDVVVLWQVSGRDTQALISFNPTGVMEVDFKEQKQVSARFNEEAVPLEFKLTYQVE